MYAREVSDLELLRGLFAQWAEGDLRGGVALFADDMHYRTARPEGWFEGTGPEGVREFMSQFLAAWSRWWVRVDQIDDLGQGRYVASGEQFARGRESGTETRYPAHVAVRMKDGKITQLGFFFNREDALAELGVTAPAP